MILLDPPTVAEALKPTPCKPLQEWLDKQIAETLHISSITIAEILASLHSAHHPNAERKDFLRETLEGLLGLFEQRVLPFDHDAARCYAELGDLTSLPQANGYIVATALSKGFSLASRDTAIYQASGVTLLNPWEAAS